MKKQMILMVMVAMMGLMGCGKETPAEPVDRVVTNQTEETVEVKEVEEVKEESVKETVEETVEPEVVTEEAWYLDEKNTIEWSPENLVDEEGIVLFDAPELVFKVPYLENVTTSQSNSVSDLFITNFDTEGDYPVTIGFKGVKGRIASNYKEAYPKKGYEVIETENYIIVIDKNKLSRTQIDIYSRTNDYGYLSIGFTCTPPENEGTENEQCHENFINNVLANFE